MLNAIRGLLGLEVPQVEFLVAPSAFSKKPSKQVMRKQNLALLSEVPVQDIQSMWDYRFRKASGTTVKDKSSSESLSQGQFLAFERPDMIYYTTSPQNTPLRAPKLPDSCFNIARVKSLSASISVLSKQHIIQETVCRENVQILGHVVWFKMAIEELNNRIQELATEIRSSEDLDTVKESADLIIKYSQLQASVTSSLEIALDTVLKQNMTLAWLSSRLKISTKIVKNSAHFERISQQKQRWHPPLSGSGHAYKTGDISCQETHYSGILQQTVSGTQTHETVATSDRFKYVEHPFTIFVTTFKMETAESIRESIRKGEWVTSIELTDAYFHVPIHPQSQKYLRFQTKKGVFQFPALPFGVATAPLEFTRIVKEVKLIAQARNLRIYQYLDDWLLRSPTKEQCLKDSENLVKFVQEQGWLINFQKSELVPTQKLDFLGYHFDLQRGLVFPTQKKLDRLKLQTVSIRKSLVLTPRMLMSFIGTLASLEKTVPLGRLHMRPFQWYLKSHWKFPQSLDKRIPVTGNFLKHLKWWDYLQNLMAGAPIHPHVHNTLVFTDASQKGWGAHLNETVLSGLWSNKEAHLHINVLELKAVLLALKGLQEHLQGQTVLIYSDNSKVVS